MIEKRHPISDLVRTFREADGDDGLVFAAGVFFGIGLVVGVLLATAIRAVGNEDA